MLPDLAVKTSLENVHLFEGMQLHFLKDIHENKISNYSYSCNKFFFLLGLNLGPLHILCIVHTN
jgi:hypothetical protein